MRIKTVVIAAAACVVLAGCEAKDEKKTENNTTISVTDNSGISTGQSSGKTCDGMTEREITGAVSITGQSGGMKLKSKGDVNLTITGQDGVICLSGGAKRLSVSGNQLDISVAGNVSVLSVSGTNNDIKITGDVSAAKISGIGNKIKAKSYATYDNTGINNSVTVF